MSAEFRGPLSAVMIVKEIPHAPFNEVLHFPFYTVFHPLVVDIACVLFWTQPACMVQKQNTQHLPQADD